MQITPINPASAASIPSRIMNEKSFSYREIGSGHEVMIPESCKIGALSILVQGENCRLIVGENCTLSGIIKIRGKNSAIIIGNGTTIGRATLYAMEDAQTISLGEDCMLSYGIYANTSDSHSIIDLSSGKRMNRPGSIAVGDHVWLGMSAFISKGISIGSGAIIAANAVVTKDVACNVAVGGNPARVLKEGVSWDRRLLPID